MKIIKELAYLVIAFDEGQRILYNTWVGKNENINKEEIKETILAYTEAVHLCKPVFCLADDTQRVFTYGTAIQKWVAETIAEAYKAVGVEKAAIVMPSDFIAQLSTEQVGEEAGELPYQLRFFEDKATALKWF